MSAVRRLRIGSAPIPPFRERVRELVRELFAPTRRRVELALHLLTRCVACEGDGECWRCGGRGTVRDETKRPNYGVRPCFVCNGSGTCGECKGSGRE